LSEPGGGPWAGGSVSWRAAPSGLIKIEAAHPTYCIAHGGAGAARRWTAPRQLLQAARLNARRMEAAGRARRWTAPSPL
jgi:hypothetical protein